MICFREMKMEDLELFQKWLTAAKRVVVQPEQEYLGSCGVLLASGFVYDAKTDIYVMEV